MQKNIKAFKTIRDLIPSHYYIIIYLQGPKLFVIVNQLTTT